MQPTTTISLGLFAAWACHDLEELFTMRETSRAVAARMPDWVPIPDDLRRAGLSQQHVNLGISLMGATSPQCLPSAFARGGARASFAAGYSPSACTASVTSA